MVTLESSIDAVSKNYFKSRIEGVTDKLETINKSINKILDMKRNN